MALNYEKLQKNSSFRILYLLKILYNKAYSKNEIIEEFKKIGVCVNKTTILKYINKLNECEINITCEKIKNKNFYSIKKQSTLNLTQDEINSSQSLKKRIILNGSENEIRCMMLLFYKFALYSEDDDLRRNLIDFDYYSKINWHLVNKLKKHCESHDIIELDYIQSSNERKDIIIHADNITTQGTSNRLYLIGMLEGAKKFSKLPIDKIFMVKKVIEKYVRYDLEKDVISYKVSKESFEKAPVDKKEVVFDKDKDIITVIRPLDDSFHIVQRLLYFCPDLYYISDTNIRNLVREKLLNMKGFYEKS